MEQYWSANGSINWFFRFCGRAVNKMMKHRSAYAFSLLQPKNDQNFLKSSSKQSGEYINLHYLKRENCIPTVYILWGAYQQEKIGFPQGDFHTRVLQ